MATLSGGLGFIPVTRIETSDIALGGNETNQPNKALNELASRDNYLYDLIAGDATAQVTFEEFKQIGISAIAQGRLTSQSGVAVSASDRLAQTTLYYTPYIGDFVALYDSGNSRWDLRQFTQVTRTLSGLLANRNYDVFAYWDGDSVEMEFVAWSGDATPDQPISQLNGIWVKSSDARRYLGSFRTRAAGQTEDSEQRRLIFNAQNQVPRAVKSVSSGSNYTYATTSWRALQNNAEANSIDLMSGLNGMAISLNASILTLNLAGTSALVQGGGACGVGINRTTDSDALTYGNRPGTNDAFSVQAGLSATLNRRFNRLTLLEYGAAGNGSSTFDLGISPGAISGGGATGMQGVVNL